MTECKPKPLSGDLETHIMKELWKRGRATVHDVRDALKSQRNLAYTTVLTTLRNLERKGYLCHEEDGRSHVFMPIVDEDAAARSSARELLDRLFDGSPARFVNALIEDEQLTPQQFEELRQQILDLRRKEEDHD